MPNKPPSSGRAYYTWSEGFCLGLFAGLLFSLLMFMLALEGGLVGFLK